jgi:uncharacterized protein (DUF2235 family)
VNPTNVTLFCRSVRVGSCEKTPDAPTVPQFTYYQAGVGTGNDIIDQLDGGATGEGIGEHIREAYSFVARNWIHDDSHGDDEIYVVGFSRGAFTARAIVGFLSTVGLLTMRGMDFFSEIYKDYKNSVYSPCHVYHDSDASGLEICFGGRISATFGGFYFKDMFQNHRRPANTPISSPKK